MTPSPFIDACFRRPVARTPVWIMRQAGRYLPEYRAIRAKTDFLTLCKTPELAAEVTIQPVEIIGVDAAIIFSDILVLPEAMGMDLIVEEGKGGPRFPEPVFGREDVRRLRAPAPHRDLRYVMEAIRLTKSELAQRGNGVPVIGFSGSPWTLACYMISGSGRDGFADALNALRSGTDVPARLLDLLTGCVADYLSAQIEAGADAVQIFDTWGGLLTPDEYRRTSLPAIAAVIERLPRKGVPVIVFSKGAGASVREIAAAGPDVVGLGPDDDIGEMRRLVGETVALQGNLDPDSLSLPADELLARAGEILSGFGKGPGHVFNLGHGIRPDAPVDNVKALVRFVKSESAQYHQ